MPLGTAFPTVLAAPLNRRQWQQNYSAYKMMVSVELIYFSLLNDFFFSCHTAKSSSIKNIDRDRLTTN